MAAILGEQVYPHKIAHLMAYQSTIVKCAKRYQGLAWAAYDIDFCRKAAKSKSLDWEVIDQSLYAKFFTGSSRPVTRCYVCLENHPSQQSPQALNPFMLQWWNPSSFQYQQSNQGQFYSQQPDRGFPPTRRQAIPQEQPLICGLFNSIFGNHCNLQICSFKRVYGLRR